MSSNTALLVIDVQESFRHRPYFRTDELPSFFDRIQKLVDGAKARGWPCVQVLHVEATGAFSEASGLVKPMREVELTPSLVLKKTRHSALAGTPLLGWLIERGVGGSSSAAFARSNAARPPRGKRRTAASRSIS